MSSTADHKYLSLAAPLGFALAGGAFTFLAFLILLFVSVVFTLYTRTGSGITERPYGKVYGGAPGAFGPGSVSGSDYRERPDWSRGTR